MDSPELQWLLSTGISFCAGGMFAISGYLYSGEPTASVALGLGIMMFGSLLAFIEKSVLEVLEVNTDSTGRHEGGESR